MESKFTTVLDLISQDYKKADTLFSASLSPDLNQQMTDIIATTSDNFTAVRDLMEDCLDGVQTNCEANIDANISAAVTAYDRGLLSRVR